MRYLATLITLTLALLALGCDNEGSSGGSGSGGQSGSTLLITTTYLPVGLNGAAYSATIEATGGSNTGYTWTIVQGALPGGLTMQPAGTPGTTITGAPTYVTYLTNFTVQVEDSDGNIATRVFNLPLNSGQPSPPTAPGPYVLVCDVSAATSGAVNAAIRNELEQLVQGFHSTDEFDIVVHSDRFAGGYVSMWGTTLPATTANVASALAWIQGPNCDAGGNVGDSMRAAWEFAYMNYPGMMTPAFLFHTTGSSATAIIDDLPAWAAYAPNGKALVVAVSPVAATRQFGEDAADLVGGTYIQG